MIPTNKHIEREPGEDDKADPNEAAERIEDDVRANRGLGSEVRPKEKSDTEEALERATERK